VGRCEAGRHACQGERYGPCVGQVLEVPETCANEGEDSNCDNVLDNIPGRGEACNTGVPGVCASGQRQCGPDAEAPICVQTILPVDETCNGQDMDCDGQVDEDFRRRGRRCGRGNQFPPQCRNGRWVCNNGREVCDLDRTGLPDTDVTCNGVDEDCDGQTDEEWVAEACNSRLRGICAEGVEVCDIPGGERCAPVREPAAEDACAEDGTGNGIDENCNDQVDEGCL